MRLCADLKRLWTSGARGEHVELLLSLTLMIVGGSWNFFTIYCVCILKSFPSSFFIRWTLLVLDVIFLMIRGHQTIRGLYWNQGKQMRSMICTHLIGETNEIHDLHTSNKGNEWDPWSFMRSMICNEIHDL